MLVCIDGSEGEVDGEFRCGRGVGEGEESEGAGKEWEVHDQQG